MNQPTAVRSDTSRPAHHRAGLAVVLVVIGLAAAIGLTSLVGLSSGPKTVARITFENPTSYALDIEVRPGTAGGWTSAGSVRQMSTAEVSEVIDQGDVWVFRFDSQGQSGGELQLSRTELEASGWRVSIPTDVGARLAAAGAPPTP
jgi:hypothetical protein